jgi:thiamine kinase-like enzyme
MGMSARTYASTAEFHDAIVANGMAFPVEASDWARECRKGFPDEKPIVFTHSDLHFSNILLTPGSPKIAAIIDWQQSGYFPAYWEYLSLMWAEGMKDKEREQFAEKVTAEKDEGAWKSWLDWVSFIGPIGF